MRTSAELLQGAGAAAPGRDPVSLRAGGRVVAAVGGRCEQGAGVFVSVERSGGMAGWVQCFGGWRADVLVEESRGGLGDVHRSACREPMPATELEPRRTHTPPAQQLLALIRSTSGPSQTCILSQPQPQPTHPTHTHARVPPSCWRRCSCWCRCSSRRPTSRPARRRWRRSWWRR